MAKRLLISLGLAASIFLSLSLAVFAAVGDTGFSDVDANAWYADAVDYVREQGLMSGTSATTFAPDAETSRAMLVTTLYRQAGSPAVQQATAFPDVPDGTWYSGAAVWASEMNIISGYSDGRFGPDDPVTREQLAAILWRYANSPAAIEAEAFADQNLISSYAASAVAWARGSGIISGKTGNMFDPTGHATRAEVAVILHRWLLVESPIEPTPPDETSKILVAYFSHTGNTRAVAEEIAEQTGGTLFEIVPEMSYPTDYNAALSQAQQELSADARPALSSHVEGIGRYETIYLGFPIWHGNTPMPIRTFLEEYNLSGKTIAPFSTSGSSGISSAVTAIRRLATGATVENGLSITESTLSNMSSLVERWLTTRTPPESTPEQGGGSTPPPTADSGEDAMPAVSIIIGEQTYTATLEDNEATRALVGQLPMTISMGELNGNEKYYFMDDSLPTAAKNPGHIETGDLMLYGNNCLVLFYESFSTSYSYTRLGRLDNPSGLAAALGSGSVDVTLRAS